MGELQQLHTHSSVTSLTIFFFIKLRHRDPYSTNLTSNETGTQQSLTPFCGIFFLCLEIRSVFQA